MINIAVKMFFVVTVPVILGMILRSLMTGFIVSKTLIIQRLSVILFLIVLGIFSITYTFMPFSMEINQAFIAAILTVIGYSLNDTVVVFDRIREFVNEHAKLEFNSTVNSALNSTLSRTLNTSLTTLLVLLAIFIFGGESIRGFMFALIVGVIVGTYSSVFIATPVMYDTQRKKIKGK